MQGLVLRQPNPGLKKGPKASRKSHVARVHISRVNSNVPGLQRITTQNIHRTAASRNTVVHSQRQADVTTVDRSSEDHLKKMNAQLAEAEKKLAMAVDLASSAGNLTAVNREKQRSALMEAASIRESLLQSRKDLEKLTHEAKQTLSREGESVASMREDAASFKNSLIASRDALDEYAISANKQKPEVIAKKPSPELLEAAAMKKSLIASRNALDQFASSQPVGPPVDLEKQRAALLDASAIKDSVTASRKALEQIGDDARMAKEQVSKMKSALDSSLKDVSGEKEGSKAIQSEVLVSKLEMWLSESRSKLFEQGSELKKMTADSNNTKLQLETTMSNLDAITKAVANLTNEVREFASKATDNEKTGEKLEGWLEEARSKMAEQATQLREIEQAMVKNKSELTATKQRLASTKAKESDLSASYKAEAGRASKSEQLSSKLEEWLTEAREKLTEQREQLQAITEEAVRMTGQVSATNAELEEQQAQRSELQSALTSDLSRGEQAQILVDKLEKWLEEGRSKMHEQADIIRKLSKEAHDAKESFSSTQRRISQTRETASSLEAEISLEANRATQNEILSEKLERWLTESRDKITTQGQQLRAVLDEAAQAKSELAETTGRIGAAKSSLMTTKQQRDTLANKADQNERLSEKLDTWLSEARGKITDQRAQLQSLSAEAATAKTALQTAQLELEASASSYEELMAVRKEYAVKASRNEALNLQLQEWLTESRAKVNEQANQLLEMTAEAERTRSELANTHTKIEGARSKQASLESARDAETSRAMQQEALATKLELWLAESRTQITEQAARLQQITSEAEKARQSVSQMQQTVVQYNNTKLETSRIAKKANEQDALVKKLEGFLAESRAKMSEQGTQIKEIREEAVKVMDQLNKAQTSLNESQRSVSLYTQERDTAAFRANQAETLSKKLEQWLAESRAKINENHNTLDEKRQEARKAKEMVQQLREEVVEFEQIKAERDEQRARTSQSEVLVGKLERWLADSRSKITEQREQLQNMTEEAKHAKQELASLKQELQQSLKSEAELAQEVDQEARRAEQAEVLAAKLQAWLDGERSKKATAQKPQVVNVEVELSELQATARKAQLRQSQLEKQLSQTHRSNRKMESEVSHLERQVATREASLNTERAENQELRMEVQKLEKDVNLVREQLSGTQSALERERGGNIVLEKDAARAKEMFLEAGDRLEGQQDMSSSIKKEAAALQRQLLEIKLNNESLMTKLNQKQAERDEALSKVRGEIASLRMTSSSGEMRARQIAEELQRAKNEMTKMESRADAAYDDLEAAKQFYSQELNAAKARTARVEKEMEKITSEYASVERELSSKLHDIMERLSVAESLGGSNNISTTVANLQGQMQAVKKEAQAAAQRNKLSMDELQRERSARLAIEAEIGKLRKKVEELQGRH